MSQCLWVLLVPSGNPEAMFWLTAWNPLFQSFPTGVKVSNYFILFIMILSLFCTFSGLYEIHETCFGLSHLTSLPWHLLTLAPHHVTSGHVGASSRGFWLSLCVQKTKSPGGLFSKDYLKSMLKRRFRYLKLYLTLDLSPLWELMIQ